MKLVSRIRGEKHNNFRPADESARAAANGGSSSLIGGGSPLVGGGSASVRDRSRSLCVEQLGLATLLHPAFEPATRDLHAKHAIQRRRASSAM